MKLAIRILAWFCAAAIGVATAEAATARSGTVRIAGRTYQRLIEWGRASGFNSRWLERGRTLQLSNRVAQLLFNVDPRSDRTKARINGIEISLAFPVLYQNGTVYITQLDVDKSLTPILSPPLNPPSVKLRTICLDAGHGGRDPGFRVGPNEEQKYTLLLAREVRDELVREGFRVFMTRTADTYLDLPARSAIARKRGADLFVSLHFNASETARDDVKGVETYRCTPAGATSSNSGGEGDTRWVPGNQQDPRNMLLAYQVQKAIVRNLHVDDRGVKRARYAVLRDATMPAILVEGGFMSHPAEGRRIYDPAYRHKMARAIADGIIAYKRIVHG